MVETPTKHHQLKEKVPRKLAMSGIVFMLNPLPREIVSPLAIGTIWPLPMRLPFKKVPFVDKSST
jgi:hypothetical protein